MSVAAKLKALGLSLPPAPAPAANYVGWTTTGDQIWVAGQGPVWGRELRFGGKVGRELTVEQGQEAARLTALNLLAQAAEAVGGDLDRITGCIKIFGLVNCDPDFADAARVVNGASELMVELFGEAGRHARAVTCAPALPIGISVELDAIFTFK